MSNRDLNRADTPAADSEYAMVHVSFELSKAKWKIGVILPASKRLSRYTIPGGDVKALAARLADWRAKAARGGKPVRIESCYEAGYDGHWLHRWLTNQGVINYVIEPASIQVNRRARRAKTDRIDLERLMRALVNYLRGEPEACSMVHVPTVEEEDRKRRSRARERLIKERTAHTNRIKGLLHAQGIRNVSPLRPGFVKSLESVRTGDGRLLPPRLKEELVEEHERLLLVSQQLVRLEANSMAERRNAQPGSTEHKIVRLATLKGIGPVSAQRLVHEAFYRDFDNGRQVGSYFGLTGTPYNSGSSVRDQGISKAGNRRAREVGVEIGWLWLQHQPDSELSKWFRSRVGALKGRIRRINLVALTRKLMVALWRYLTSGMVPTGAVLRPTF
jgi:transposase